MACIRQILDDCGRVDQLSGDDADVTQQSLCHMVWPTTYRRHLFLPEQPFGMLSRSKSRDCTGSVKRCSSLLLAVQDQRFHSRQSLYMFDVWKRRVL